MPDILIRGMEMPSKENQVLLLTPDGDVWLMADMPCETEHLTHIKAVELPPHGDLIEAEHLAETLDYYIREAGWGNEINKALGWVRDDFIKGEPVIVPASEEATND